MNPLTKLHRLWTGLDWTRYGLDGWETAVRRLISQDPEIAKASDYVWSQANRLWRHGTRALERADTVPDE